MCAQRKLKLACAYAQSDQNFRSPHGEKSGIQNVSNENSKQSDLNLRWAHISESTFSDIAVHIIKTADGCILGIL